MKFYCYDHDIGKEKCSYQCNGCKEWFPKNYPNHNNEKMKFYCFNRIDEHDGCKNQCESCYERSENYTVEIIMQRNVVQWLCRECFPLMVEMAVARKNCYPKTDVEYWNCVIVLNTLKQVKHKFEKKREAKTVSIKFKLNPAESYCLYRFLFNYPVDEQHVWKIMNKQFIIDQIYKQLKESV